jgi:hypothetical protein
MEQRVSKHLTRRYELLTTPNHQVNLVGEQKIMLQVRTVFLRNPITYICGRKVAGLGPKITEGNKI